MNTLREKSYKEQSSGKHFRIGFLVDTYTFRGTAIATWDYAFYNESLLHNSSIIISPMKKSSEDIPDVSSVLQYI
jgi:hypothetical protein